MQSSKRAVEAYWRTRLIDQVTTDDDKVAPVYRLDEICHTIRSSSSDIVREMLDYAMKRLDSKSPRVKQKTLRMIKYVVAKGGPEFRRQMQRQSAAIRQLFDYKGQVDDLRGDALNKAVRDTAKEAIAAIFASDDKPPQMEDASKRIMGFGSTNYDMPAEGKKSLINEVVEIGSASIRQGLSRISELTTTGNTRLKSNDSGSYRGPSLRKSLTSERETIDMFRMGQEETGDVRISLESTSARAGTSAYGSRFVESEVRNGRERSENGRGASQEERLLENITAPGGMRLQPTRENLQTFLANALKLDPKSLGYALESKLRSHAWQVRFKALCVLEAILRQNDHEFFGIVAEIFEKDEGIIKECLQLPQTSVREKARKVLDHLGVSSKDDTDKKSEGPADLKDESPQVIYDVPDLIDTSEPGLLADAPDLSIPTFRDNILRTSNSPSTAGDLLGDELWNGTAELTPETSSDNLFAGVSFITSDSAAGEFTGDLFSGLSVDGNGPSDDHGIDLLLNNPITERAELAAVKQPAPSDKVVDLMANVSLSSPGDGAPLLNGLGENGITFPHSMSMEFPHHSNDVQSHTLGRLSSPLLMYNNPSLVVPTGMVGGFQAPMMPQNFGPGARGNTFYQQQLSSGIGGMQRFGRGINNINREYLQARTGPGRGLDASFADGFDFSGDSTSKYAAAVDLKKREDTKAFDFISDHMSAARGPKRSS